MVCQVDVRVRVCKILLGAGQPGTGDMTADAIYRHIGSQLRRARTRRRLTQSALAARANLTRTSLANIEAGRQRVTLHALLEMAAALDLDAAALLPDMRSAAAADIDVFMKRGARRDEAEALARALRG